MRKWTGRRGSFGCIMATLLTPSSIILRRRRRRALGADFTAITTFGYGFGFGFGFRYVVECYTASAVVSRSVTTQKWEAEGGTQ